MKHSHNFRNCSLGSELLIRAIEHCKGLGCTQIDGWMHGDIKRLRLFYERFGFKTSGIVISLTLKDFRKNEL
ncbi:GNAT family N-acetyltransferase [Enterovibrio baiacu]|uniref:GNAT family N-acetyltransferase n=1 Tax=Enterovibrio baiacu TaxID=2491023 RepID=UPI003B84A1A9